MFSLNYILHVFYKAQPLLKQLHIPQMFYKQDIPTDWTKAVTIVLHKNEDTEYLENYRPISVHASF